MLRPLTSGDISDLRLCGHIIHTGHSSMEVAVKMELIRDKDETVMLGGLSRGAQASGSTMCLLFLRSLFNGLSRCTHTES